MELDGTRGRQTPQAQRTSTVPPQRTLPFDLAAWATEPRPDTPPGIFRLGHHPHDETRAEQAAVSARPLLLRAALNLAVAWLAFVYGRALCLNLLAYVVNRLEIGTRLSDGHGGVQYVVPAGQRDLIALIVNVLLLAVVIRLFGRMGRWKEIYRRYAKPLLARTVTQEEAPADTGSPGQEPDTDPWHGLRGVAPQAARRLEAEPVGDVDYARIRHAWETVLADPELLPAFAEQVEVRGAAACAHPSEARDLPGRAGRHDLLTRQVRLGAAQNVVKNPPAHRSAGFALDPQLLGTSLLAVGPAGTGKTARLARPVAEALCLQALAGTACAVVIGAAEADLGPDAWYDVVIAPGDPESPYGLDLYGAAADPDEAAARLADALLPDELAARAEAARTALQQVVGPFHAAHGRYPAVRELRALLGGDPDAWAVLRKALQAGGLLAVHEGDLQHRESRHGRVDDPGTLLADRLALLDRPAFARSFAGGPDALPPFAMRALEHPLRVRVKLPERSHPEVARMLSRLVVAQFVQAASARAERSLFAGLVVDDASAAVDAQIVRGLQRMRGANAGAVLLLRTLVDLPEPLRAPLFGAVGCRMAFPGIAPWDGRLFSEAWGTHLVTETAVTHTPDTSGGLVRKAARAGRKALSGTTAQTESVTTRDVERHRWSPSDLAHALPSGHAVVSLTTVDGEQVPPLLVDLRD
ncbi:ATP-binding protein [Kitasatospora sp. NPDC085879]|uniref:ATP-binding protein n=1 Tax=Kitasatospora sp. NPDC085879 TaxID=3154769 RepID=UPI003424C48B